VRKILLFGLLASISGVLLGFGGTTIAVKWTNEEALKWQKQKWDEHCKQYGTWASNVIFCYSVNTNWGIAAIHSGSNMVPVELGFRDDGVVVWRKRQ